MKKPIRNEDLYSNYKEALKQSLNFLKTYEAEYSETQKKVKTISSLLITTKDIQIRFNQKPVLKSSKHVQFYYVIKPSISLLLATKRKEIKELRGVTKLIERGESDDPNQIFNRLLYLQKFIEEYVDSNESLTFSEREFDKQYLKFEEEFYSDPYAMVALIPLDGFSSNVKGPIKIDDDTRIKKITKKEKERLLSPYGMHTCIFSDPLDIEWVLEIKYIRPKTSAMNDGLGMERLKRIIGGMRIFKKGNFGINTIYRKNQFTNQNQSTSFPNFPKFYGSSKYVIDKTELKSFKKFMKTFISLKINGKLENAIDRFNYGYEREKIEDKYIDYMIALEVLYSKGNESTSVICLRATRFLENEIRKREETYKNIKSLFKERGGLLHANKKTTNEKCELCYDMLHSSLNKFIKELEHKKSVETCLENILLT